MKQQLAVLHLQEEVLRAESDLQARMEGKSITSSLNRRAAPSRRGLSCNLTAVFLFVLDGNREGGVFLCFLQRIHSSCLICALPNDGASLIALIY